MEANGLVTHLCKRGLLLSDDDAFASLREQDSRLSALGWLPTAAVHHYATRGRGMRVGQVDYARIGEAPPAFHSRSGKVVELPHARGTGGLYDALARRATAREFVADRGLTLEQLATLLYEVFGCRGRVELHPGVEVLKKGAPSAGALHPVEAYPVVRHVDGVEPGLYHYSVRDHALVRLEDFADDVPLFTARQDHFASAPLALVLTARFRRSFWKYRRHRTAYAAVLMDAAHLSQTLYLVAADLGLHAFFTNVINDGDIDDRLGLDGIDECALAVCGCGYAVDSSERAPRFEPYSRDG